MAYQCADCGQLVWSGMRSRHHARLLFRKNRVDASGYNAFSPVIIAGLAAKQTLKEGHGPTSFGFDALSRTVILIAPPRRGRACTVGQSVGESSTKILI